MPHVSTIISGAASLGVLAGVVSGIFYLVLTGIRWAGRLRAALQEEEKRRQQNGVPPGSCVICGRPPASVTPVGCQDCGGRACRGGACSRRCSRGWTCLLCHVKRDLRKTPGSWFNQKPESEQLEAIEDKQKENIVETVQVREFIEKLVETLVGGPLDGVTVGKLSNHEAYVDMFTKYHELLCQSLARLGFALQLSIANEPGDEVDSPSNAHTALKKLVDKIVAEAMALPDIKEKASATTNHTAEDEDFSNKSYEDILATAILNKVIEKCQQQELQQSTRLGTTDKNSNLVRDSSVGTDSLQDEDMHSNSDWSDTSRTEPLSLTIEERIEEITTTFESSDEEDRRDLTEVEPQVTTSRRVPFPELGMDILDAHNESENEGSSDSDDHHSSATELHTSTTSWEENWLFQKKKLRTTPSAHHPVPVPMLVPNPSQEFRALIGGVDADDLSDMSECSDSVLEDVVMVESEVDAELTKKMVDALNEDVEESAESQSIPEKIEGEVRAEPVVVEEVEEESNGKEETTEEVVDSSPVDTVDSLESTDSAEQSLAQKDRECDVEFDSIHQIGVSKAPVPLPRNSELINTEPVVTEKPPICPIAEREKAKWNNPIEMKDNPYSAENIAKREQQKQKTYLPSSRSVSSASADFPDDVSGMEEESEPERAHRYGRDYYIRSARSPTGDIKNRSSTGSPRPVSSEASFESAASETPEPVPPPVEQPPKPVSLGTNASHTTTKPKVLIRTHAIDVVDNGVQLPSVKKLAKQFTIETKPNISPPPYKQDSRATPPLVSMEAAREEKEQRTTPEVQPDLPRNKTDRIKIDAPKQQEKIPEEVIEIQKYSPKPKVNGIAVQEDQPKPASRTKLNGTKNEPLIIERPYQNTQKFNPKQVHSLTARSISKEFREGLKKNSYQRVVTIDRGSLGENEQVEVCSADQNRPPTPPIDLRKTKKFWEDIINTNKQKK